MQPKPQNSDIQAQIEANPELVLIMTTWYCLPINKGMSAIGLTHRALTHAEDANYQRSLHASCILKCCCVTRNPA